MLANEIQWKYIPKTGLFLKRCSHSREETTAEERAGIVNRHTTCSVCGENIYISLGTNTIHDHYMYAYVARLIL